MARHLSTVGGSDSLQIATSRSCGRATLEPSGVDASPRIPGPAPATRAPVWADAAGGSERAVVSGFLGAQRQARQLEPNKKGAEIGKDRRSFGKIGEGADPAVVLIDCGGKIPFPAVAVEEHVGDGLRSDVVNQC